MNSYHLSFFLKPVAGCAMFAGFVLTTSPAVADTWDFDVTVDLGAIYSDNIFLADDDLKKGEFVYFIAPEMALSTDGERIDADIRYRPEAYLYGTNNDSDNIYHIADASMTSAIVRDKLFLYLKGSRFQSIISSDDQLPTTNIPISFNRVDSTVLEARPYWEQQLGGADLFLEASFIDSQYDDDAFQGNFIRRGLLRLDNIEREQGFAWGVEYEYLESEYDVSPEFVYQRALGNLGYWVNSNLRIFGAGGAETPLEDLMETSLGEDSWEVGFQYKPSQRFDLEVAGGRRFFGNSYRLGLEYRLRWGTMTLRYDESPTTGAQIILDRQPIIDTDSIDGILDEPGRSDRFLRRFGEWSTSIDLSKSELTLRLVAETREQRIDADSTPLADEQLAGVALRWSWAAGTNTQVELQADRSRRDEDIRKDDLTRLQASLAYSFSERLAIRLEFQHSKQVGQDTNEQDYKENQYRLFFRASL